VLIRLIGPVTITAGAKTTRINAPKRACVLAVLAAEPGVPVSQADLVDRVWGGAPPETVTSVLYSYIARLRVDLKPAGVSIERVAGHGYVLQIDTDDVDVHRLRALASQAAQSDDALELWRRACALAQGEPLAGLSGDWAEKFRTVFARERAGLLASRYAAELAAGRHAAVVDELSALAAEGRFAEPLVGHLMLALYRCGRPADALRWFEVTRRRLRDELGADPSPDLRALHKRILDQDPALSTRAGSPAAEAPAQLPADIATFTGRDEDLAALSTAARRRGTVLVTGQAGAGKTALSVHWGQSRRADFPDGQLYINLRGFDRGETVSPHDALGRLLHALGVADVPADLDHAAELFRARTTGRRMLVVLDNAGTAAQVRPLMPGAGCFTIVTSRDKLPGLVAVDDAAVVALNVLTRADSAQLLRRILGEVDDADADTLAGLCGDLPLALRIAAANLASGAEGGIASYTRDLANRDRLALLAVDGDPDATVTAALDQSYAALDAQARGLFCRIGAIPGEDASGEVIAAVSGLPPEAADRVLRRLVSANLVDEYRPGRFRTHDLVRLYAAERAKTELGETGVDTVVDAFIDWHADHVLEPAIEEEANLLHACDTLREDPRMWRLARRFMDAVNGGRFLDRIEKLVTAGLRQAHATGDPLPVFQMENLRACLLRSQRDTAASIELGRHVIELAASLGKRQRMAALGNQGLRFYQAGELREATHLLIRAVGIAADIGRADSMVSFGTTAVKLLVILGELDEAGRVLELVESVDDDAIRERTAPRRLLALADHQNALGDTDAALESLTEVIAVAAASTPPFSASWCLSLGNSLTGVGRPDLAQGVLEANIAFLRAHPSTVHEPAILHSYAMAMNALGEHNRALEVIAEAERKWHRKPAYAYPWADLIVAQAFNGLGDHRSALSHAQNAAAAYDTMEWLERRAAALSVVETARAGLVLSRTHVDAAAS